MFDEPLVFDGGQIVGERKNTKTKQDFLDWCIECANSDYYLLHFDKDLFKVENISEAWVRFQPKVPEWDVDEYPYGAYYIKSKGGRGAMPVWVMEKP